MKALVAAVLLLAACSQAFGDARKIVLDPPRWRLRAALIQGFGGSREGGETVAMFPTTLELGIRLWGPLSLTVAGQGVIAGTGYSACGVERRPNTALGTLGARFDLWNRRAKPWVDPFVEVHGGLGGQGGGREQNGVCGAPALFGTGGARLGIDVWLGRVAVTVVVAFDDLPIASPLSGGLGASFILR